MTEGEYSKEMDASRNNKRTSEDALLSAPKRIQHSFATPQPLSQAVTADLFVTPGFHIANASVHPFTILSLISIFRSKSRFNATGVRNAAGIRGTYPYINADINADINPIVIINAGGRSTGFLRPAGASPQKEARPSSEIAIEQSRRLDCGSQESSQTA